MNATIKVVLKTDYIRHDGTVNIRLRLTISPKVKYYPLNMYVLSKYFKRGYVLRGDVEYSNKNLLIDKYANKANKIIFDYRLNDIPINFENFDRDFSYKQYGSKSVYDFIDLQIETLEGKFAANTLKGYIDQSNKLKCFRPVLLFRDIDRNFITQYELFLIKERKNKPNIINTLRYFLFCCYTGLRYSDIFLLRFSDILDNEFISIYMDKTKDKVTIPLIDKAKDLIPKQYFKNDKVFKVFVNQTSNKHLKYIMKVAKINKSISFHCSRDTFATLSKTLGMEYDVISKILGHADIKTTQCYVKYEISHLENEMEKWNK